MFVNDLLGVFFLSFYELQSVFHVELSCDFWVHVALYSVVDGSDLEKGGELGDDYVVHIGWLVVRAVIGCMWIDYATRVVASTQ